MKKIVLFFALVQSVLGFPLEVQISTITSIDQVGGINEINKRISKRVGLVHGDILPPRGKNTLLSGIWSSTTIPVSLSSSLPYDAIAAFNLAVEEFKLRTCINIVTRTTETNYISVQPLSGCYSSVGMVGGVQTLSLGSGCETRAITIHEFLHALGIYHEQSRADRDDYITIETSNVEADRIHNFNKLTWTTSSVRRQPYDYFSIMHYSAYSFGIDSSIPVIVTKNSAFQSVVGQRSTFSRSDSEKVNLMYECSDALLVSYYCDFEDSKLCGYVKDFSGDNLDWMHYVIGSSSVTSPASPPNTDGTYIESNRGSYMLLDTSGSAAGQTGQLRSMRLLSSASSQCLQFSYYLDRADASSTSSISVYVAQIDSTTGDITALGSAVANLNQDYGSSWNLHHVTISAPSVYRLVFVATTGSNTNDVIAIDDVSVQDRACETAYHVFSGFTSQLTTATQGDIVSSSTSYTDDGYAFNLGVFPAGASSSVNGYVGLFFGLTQGDNDSSITWPFSNRFIQLTILDQSGDPLYALSKHGSFLTDSSTTFEQPSGSVNYRGYSNFIQASELTSSSSGYLKGDNLLVSVLITKSETTTTTTSTTTTTTTTTTSTTITTPIKPAETTTTTTESTINSGRRASSQSPDLYVLLLWIVLKLS